MVGPPTFESRSAIERVFTSVKWVSRVGVAAGRGAGGSPAGGGQSSMLVKRTRQCAGEMSWAVKSWTSRTHWMVVPSMVVSPGTSAWVKPASPTRGVPPVAFRTGSSKSTWSSRVFISVAAKEAAAASALVFAVWLAVPVSIHPMGMSAPERIAMAMTISMKLAPRRRAGGMGVRLTGFRSPRGPAPSASGGAACW